MLGRTPQAGPELGVARPALSPSKPQLLPRSDRVLRLGRSHGKRLGWRVLGPQALRNPAPEEATVAASGTRAFDSWTAKLGAAGPGLGSRFAREELGRRPRTRNGRQPRSSVHFHAIRTSSPYLAVRNKKQCPTDRGSGHGRGSPAESSFSWNHGLREVLPRGPLDARLPGAGGLALNLWPRVPCLRSL